MQNKKPQAQKGIVLIVALVMLAVVSMLAAFSVRGAMSSEAVNGSVRQGQLASQATEIALRYCEDALTAARSGTTPFPGVIQEYSVTPAWQNVSATWDASSTSVMVVPLSEVNRTGAVSYKRAPECVVEHMVPTGSPNRSASFVVTARGFGPEVPAVVGSNRQPEGSEVFLQSTVEY